MLEPTDVRDLLETYWGIGELHAFVPQLESWNSHVWLVEHRGGRQIVKVARERGQLQSGLQVAQEVEKAGILSGVAVPTVGGAMTVPIDDWEMAVLTYVPGRSLDATNRDDVELWATTLGRLHSVMVGIEAPEGTERWPWEWPDANHECLERRPDVRVVVNDAVSQARRTVERGAATLGLVHADPGPTNFRVDDAGGVGVIDWGQATWGPLLYDLGSMLVFHEWFGKNIHADTMLDHYWRASPITEHELEFVDVFKRLKWAVHAWWSANLIIEDEQLGIESSADNHGTLAVAMAALSR